MEQGATGVTTNPLLASRTMRGRPDVWAEARRAVPKELPAEEQAETLMRHVATWAAERLLPQYEATRGRLGYVCGQVNLGRVGDRTAMLAMARRYHGWSLVEGLPLP